MLRVPALTLPALTMLAVLAGAAGLLTMAAPTGVAAQQNLGLIEEIAIEGTQRIEPETVRTQLLVAPGDAFDTERINESLKRLYATGFFSDVSIRREGSRLVVVVAENPVINRIAFEGNQRLDDDELQERIQLRERFVYTRSKVQQDAQTLIETYRRTGWFAATVEPKVIRLEQNRVDLVFEIDEGDQTGVSRIMFVGNRLFSDSELRDVITTEESSWFNIFSVADTYDPDRLAFDQEQLRKFYLSEGYADFRVISAVAELTEDRENFFITFTIEEGERYRFGTINIDSLLPNLDVDALFQELTTEPGDWYDAEKVEESIGNLDDKVGTYGYAFIDIRPQIEKDEEGRLINLTYEIGEGPKVFVERINIRGNVRTEDRVIRREFRLVEGDAFNTSKLRRSQQRIQNLGFFASVDVQNNPGSAPDRTVIDVEVEEQSTGELSFGLGYSTLDGPIGDISIRERNFLGRGQDLRLRFQGSGRSQTVDLGFTEPYFLDRPLAAGFDVFRINQDQQDESSFDQDELGFRLRTGFNITERMSQSISYSLRRVQITNVGSSASRSVQAQEGESTISELTTGILYDQRDSRFATTEGYFGRVGVDLAGLGGSVRYARTRIDGGYYIPLLEDVVMSFTLEGGAIFGLGQDVRLSDRFFLGGSQVRGFEIAGIGPRDEQTQDSLGGNFYYAGTAQVRFPLGLPEELGISGRAFMDVGGLFGVESDDDVEVGGDSATPRSSVGAGLGWISPFGPINLDYAFPITSNDNDREENFRVSFGTNF